MADRIRSPGGATDRRSIIPQSFVSLHVHIVFSTKRRAALIDETLAPRLYKYLGGIARNTGSVLVAAGGMADHVHLLCSLGKETSVSELVRNLKSNSSRWIHEEFPMLRGFAWQTGYGAFAVSYSGMDDVKSYIANQQEHHRTRTFQDELRALLRRHEIEWDERYLWD